MKNRTRRPLRPTPLPWLPIAVLLAAAVALPALSARAEEPREAVVIRPAAPPSALERARMERWRRAWREESRGLDRAIALALRAAEVVPARRRAHCEPLAEVMLGIDRDRVLPVPDPVADLHLRRALEQATRAAVDCLDRRPYAARGRLRRASADLAAVERRLERYRARPDG
jgi:hypothetical protein